MINNEKQREFFEMLASAITENKPSVDKNEEFAKTSFALFTTLVKTGFTEDQALMLMAAVITAVARS